MCSYRCICFVKNTSKTINGGHEIIDMYDKDNNILTCAAYEKTGKFRNVIRSLIPGDNIEIFGSFINNTFNLEKINILNLVDDIKFENPICKICNKKMKSCGKDKGFKCTICKAKEFHKIKINENRKINIGYYEVTPSARRHLSKPLILMKKDGIEDNLLHPLL